MSATNNESSGEDFSHLIEEISNDLLLFVIEFLDLPTVYKLLLLNNRWNKFINTSQHLWKTQYSYLDPYGAEFLNFTSSSLWKQELEVFVTDLRFEPSASQPPTTIISNNGRTLYHESADSVWRMNPFEKVIDLKSFAGKTMCFQVTLDHFSPKAPIANFFSVTIGCTYWSDKECSTNVVGLNQDSISFGCGNKVVFYNGVHSLTQGATSDYSWPDEMIQQGDVIGVKISVAESGDMFGINFYLNGVKRDIVDKCNTGLKAKYLRPGISCIHKFECTLQRVNPETFD